MTYFRVLILLILTAPAFGQPGNTKVLQPSESPKTFFELQDAMNTHFERDASVREEEEERGEEEAIWRRQEWFLEPRLFPSGKMENLTLKTIKAYKKFTSQRPDARSTHGQWSFLGPVNVNGNGYIPGIGRVNCFVIDPSNSNIIYVGSSNGGIWKTTNGGTTWNNVSPDIPLLAITDIELDPNNASVVYALTGDGEPWYPPVEGHGHFTGGVRGMGVIKSSDGGNTWYPTGFTFNYPYPLLSTALLINPNSADTQFVATLGNSYRTVDNWNSYTPMGFGAFDIEYHPTDTKIMYCSGTSWIRRSTNGGESWEVVADSDFSIIVDTIADRIELAVTPDLPSAVYALVGGNSSNTTIAIFKSLSNGINNSWTIQDSTDELIDGQAFYNCSLAVKDTDHNDVFAAGVWARRSYNSGLTWDTINGPDNFNIHADVHDIQYRDGILFLATDGGLYKSADDGDTWTNLWAGLGTMEIYRISGTPQNPNLNYCGSQDNGITQYSGSSTFDLELSGDGTVTQINYLNSDTIFGCVQYGDCHRSVDGYQSWAVMQVSAKPGAWIAPMTLDPVYPNIIFLARDSIFRSTNSGNNGSWVYIGRPVPSVRCMQQGTSNRNRMYVSRDSVIYRTNNALANPGPATWVDISAGLPGLYITDIAVNPDNSDDVYICYSGYEDGSKVFRSTTGGDSSWVNISGSLPNVPLNCIAFHDNGNNGLYVGSDIGVFYKDNSLDDWIYYSNSLPVVIVNDFYINISSGKIVAGTYGRGLWQADLYAGCDATLTLGPGNIGGHRYYSATNWISSTHDYDPDLGTNIHYNAGNYIDLKPGFEVSELGYFEGKIGPCPPIYPEEFSTPPPSSHPFIFTAEALTGLLKKD